MRLFGPTSAKANLQDVLGGLVLSAAGVLGRFAGTRAAGMQQLVFVARISRNLRSRRRGRGLVLARRRVPRRSARCCASQGRGPISWVRQWERFLLIPFTI